MRVLAAIVRLAEGLDRSHAEVIGTIAARPGRRRVTFRLTPKGNADLEIWAAGRHATALEEVLETKVAFELTARKGKKKA